MSDLLFDLVNSLNKSEKRNFNLYVSKYSTTKNIQSSVLFKAINRLSHYDEEKLRKSTSKYISKEQFTYAKHRLKNQILESLVDLHFVRTKDANIISIVSKIELGFRTGHTKIAEEWIEKGLEITRENGSSAWEVVLLGYKIRYLFQTERSNENSKVVRKNLIDLCHKIARDQEYVSVYDEAMECLLQYSEDGSIENIQEKFEYVKSNPILSADLDQLSEIQKLNYYKTKYLLSIIEENFDEATEVAENVIQLYELNLKSSKKNLRPYLLSISNLILAAIRARLNDKALINLQKLESAISENFPEENESKFIYDAILQTNNILFLCLTEKYSEIINRRDIVYLIFEKYQDSQWVNIRQTLLCLTAAYFKKKDYKSCLDIIFTFNQLSISKSTEALLLHIKFYEYACHHEIKNEKFKVSVLRSLDYYIKKRNPLKAGAEESIFLKLSGNEYEDKFEFTEDEIYMKPFMEWLNKN